MNPRKGRKKNTKVLLIIYGDIHFGGVSVLLNNLLANMDKSDLEFTLYSYGRVVDEAIYQKYLDNGVKVILGNEKTYNRKNFAKNLFKIMFFKKYDIVHVNTGALDLTFVSLFVAKICGIKTRIAHSHSKKNSGLPYNEDELRCKKRISKYATIKLSCSAEASEHMFGDPNALLISNGIDISKFTFDHEQRKEARAALNLNDKLVIGTVGRLEPVKNQAFILDIAKELKKTFNVAVILVGDGSQKQNLMKRAEELNLKDEVTFAKSTDRVDYYLNAFDIFLIPSIAEGLGIAAIEAQSTDLPVWGSTALPIEAAITEKIFLLDIQKDAALWAESITEYVQKHNLEDRHDRKDIVQKKGYDILDSAEKLHNIYLGSRNR